MNRNGAPIYCFNDHTGMVSDVKFHPDGTCVASCGSDKKIKIFDVRSHRLLQHYDAHTDLINTVSFHPQGTYLISTSNDSTMKIWDLRKGHILYTLQGHDGWTTSASFSMQGDYFCTGGKDSAVLLWESNLATLPQESLPGMATKVKTEHYQTQKEVAVDCIVPPKKHSPTKKENNSKASNKPDGKKVVGKHTPEIQPDKGAIDVIAKMQRPMPKLGDGYAKLRPEVKQTIDTVMYELEMITKTLHVLESRIGNSESKLQMVMNHIKNEDLQFRPTYSASVIDYHHYDQANRYILGE